MTYDDANVAVKMAVLELDKLEEEARVKKQELGVPFVYGDTANRLDVVNQSDVVLISRVGDEGLSLKDLDRVIEIDFQFGSRRQEGQRMGRLFHSEKKGEHNILMTEQEYTDYSKRLNSIYEKGFRIKMIR